MADDHGELKCDGLVWHGPEAHSEKLFVQKHEIVSARKVMKLLDLSRVAEELKDIRCKCFDNRCIKICRLVGSHLKKNDGHNGYSSISGMKSFSSFTAIFFERRTTASSSQSISSDW
jgi:hypothetical protein